MELLDTGGEKTACFYKHSPYPPVQVA